MRTYRRPLHRRKTREVATGVLFVAVLGGALVGCSANGDTAAQPTTPSASSEPPVASSLATAGDIRACATIESTMQSIFGAQQLVSAGELEQDQLDAIVRMASVSLAKVGADDGSTINSELSALRASVGRLDFVMASGGVVFDIESDSFEAASGAASVACGELGEPVDYYAVTAGG